MPDFHPQTLGVHTGNCQDPAPIFPASLGKELPPKELRHLPRAGELINHLAEVREFSLVEQEPRHWMEGNEVTSRTAEPSTRHVLSELLAELLPRSQVRTVDPKERCGTWILCLPLHPSSQDSACFCGSSSPQNLKGLVAIFAWRPHPVCISGLAASSRTPPMPPYTGAHVCEHIHKGIALSKKPHFRGFLPRDLPKRCTELWHSRRPSKRETSKQTKGRELPARGEVFLAWM